VADVTNAPLQPPESGIPVDAQKKPSFFSTTTGKIVLGAIALVVLLAIIGVILAVVVFGGALSWLKSGTATTSTKPAVTTSTSATPTAAPILEPAEKPLAATFTFRNVFAPSIKAPVPASTETSTGASGSTDSPDTLYLVDIVSTDSGRQAVFVWNNVTYTLSNGGVIPDSPWKVMEIGTDSVVMLYGDTQVTLTLGQGISK